MCRIWLVSVEVALPGLLCLNCTSQYLYHMVSIPAVCTPHWHLCCPRSHHRWCPKYHSHTPPPFLFVHLHYQRVERLHWCRLLPIQNEIHKCIKDRHVEPSQGAFIIHIQPHQNSGTYTFTDHTGILKMRAAQHSIHIRILITCQDGRFHPIAIEVGHQNWARPLTIDSISC